MLDCFRGLRADENAVAFGSGASLRPNKVSFFGFFYVANAVGDEKEVRPRLFVEFVLRPPKRRPEIRPHVERRRCQILQPVYVDLEDLLFARSKDDPVRFPFFLFGLQNTVAIAKALAQISLSPAMLPDPSTAIKIGPVCFFDRILVTVGKEVFVQKLFQKQILPFFSDGEVCQLIRQDSARSPRSRPFQPLF